MSNLRLVYDDEADRLAGAPMDGRVQWSRLALEVFTLPARAFAIWVRRQRDARNLDAMDDRILADIGVSRSDIGRAVRYGREIFPR